MNLPMYCLNSSLNERGKADVPEDSFLKKCARVQKMFETKKYLSSSERADMAKLLNVTEQQVKQAII